MQINKISNINFRENVQIRKANSENAILMLRDPNASIRFQQSQELAKNADSIDSNPIVALGYKLYRTFNMIKDSDNTKVENKQLDRVV